MSLHTVTLLGSLDEVTVASEGEVRSEEVLEGVSEAVDAGVGLYALLADFFFFLNIVFGKKIRFWELS
jgi:hypothetical protein